MRKALLYISILLVVFPKITNAQQIRSRAVTVHVNTKKELTVVKDTIPPAIAIISPGITMGESYKTNNQSFSLIGKIVDPQSGVATVFVDSKPYPVLESGLFAFETNLNEGINDIHIVAADKQDNISNLKLKVEYQSAGQINAAKLNVNGKFYALLIGIDKYQDSELPDLSNPIRDTEAFYKVLTSNYIFEKDNIILLKNARRSDIHDALDDMAKKITHEDNLLIFYAGHGWWDKKANVGYWLPADADHDRKADWFRNSSLCDYLKEINSKHTLLITDACFAGAIFKTRGVTLDAPKAIQLLYEMNSRKAMTSGTLTEVPDRSAFTRYLLDRLEKNDEKYISSEQLFASFRIAVINNSDVVPQYGEIKNVGDEGGDFIFIKK